MIDTAELRALLDARRLAFPIETKDDFVAQMTASDARLTIGGTEYDTAFASALIPAFFFPLESADDLAGKAKELLISRGLLTLPAHASAGET